MSDPVRPRWTLAELFGFRFLFAYLILFFFPFPSGLVNPDWLGGPFDKVWGYVVPQVAAVLGITIPRVNKGGSGDTTFDYLRVVCMLVAAILAAVIWSVLDRRRGDYRTLHAWTRI